MPKYRFLIYALPGFVLSFPTLPLYILLPDFYAQHAGLGLALTGSIFLLLRSIDIISDPLIGYLIDCLPAKWGRFKPVFISGAVLIAPAVYMLLSPPDMLQGSSAVIHLLVWGALLFIGWTAIQIPYLAWVGFLTYDSGERLHFSIYREVAGLAGILSFALIGFLLIDMLPTQRLTYIAWITLILGLVCFTLPLLFLPDTYKKSKTPKFSFPRQNTLFWRLLSVWSLNSIANGLPAVCFPLFITYILQGTETQRTSFLFLYFASAICAMPVWLMLNNKMEKHRIWSLAMLAACMSFSLVFWVGVQDIFLFALVTCLTGITLGADLTLPPTLQADCIDWDRVRFRQDRAATLFALWGMASKAALGLAIGVAFPVLEWAGLSGPVQTLPNLALIFLYLIYAGLPIVLKLCAIACLWHFPLTRQKQNVLKHTLERR